MSDRTEILNLVYRYAQKVDEGDVDGVANLLGRGEKRSVTQGYSPTVYRGYDEIHAFYSGIKTHEGLPLTRHTITNAIVTIDEGAGQAVVESYFHITQFLPGQLPRFIGAGRYHDSFVRDANGWYFVSKTIYGDFLGDLSNHFTPQ